MFHRYYVGLDLWTAVRCRRGKRMFCAARELDPMYLFRLAPNVIFD